MDLHTRHVGNDAVLKGSFKPYLTTNAAVPPLFQKILKEGGGGKMNANLCAGAIWTRREGVSCCLLLHARSLNPSQLILWDHLRGGLYTVENALSIIR